jgi:hypothetical protein
VKKFLFIVISLQFLIFFMWGCGKADQGTGEMEVQEQMETAPDTGMIDTTAVDTAQMDTM